jgi:hypothetical protein
MTWTTSKPNMSGWWWARMKGGKGAVPMKMEDKGGKITTQMGVPVDSLDYEWSDAPLEEPK